MYALIVGRAYPDKKTGMMGIFEFEQAVALNRHGFKSIYAFCDTRSIKSLRIYNSMQFISNDVPVYGYHLPIGGLPRKYFELIKTSYFKKVLNKIIRENGKPAIVHVHFPLINLTEAIWEFLRELNIPIVVTEHWSKVQLKVIESHRIDLLKRIVEESESFNCVGESLRESVIELTGTSKKIEIIPNMVKPIFNYEKNVKPKDRVDFISIGRLVDTKRVGLLIDAFAEAFPNHNNIHLNIVGDGPLFSRLEKKIKNIGMTNQITLHGYLPRDETAKLLKYCDVYVSASVVETFGVPFIEAMACGKPVIGISNGGISSYINESNGILFEQDNLRQITNALRVMYENKDSYNDKWISDKTYEVFSEEAIVTQLKSIYYKQIK